MSQDSQIEFEFNSAEDRGPVVVSTQAYPQNEPVEIILGDVEKTTLPGGAVNYSLSIANENPFAISFLVEVGDFES